MPFIEPQPLPTRHVAPTPVRTVWRLRLGLLLASLGIVVLSSCGSSSSGGNPPASGSGATAGSGSNSGSGSSPGSGVGSASGSTPGSGSMGGGSGSTPGSGSMAGSGSTPGSGSTSGGASGGADGGVVGADAGMIALPTDLSCNGITVTAADVISDFQAAKPLMYSIGSRGGTAWYSYGAEDTTTTVGASTPGAGSNAFAVDPTVAGPCGKNGALKVSSQGNTGYGVGFGVNMMPDKPIGTKQTYDAGAAAYTGIGFWMKCSSETQFVYFKVPDAANDAQVATPQCSYSGMNPTRVCNQFGIKNVAVLPTWTHYQVYFSEALQDWKSNPNSFSASLDPSKLTAFQIQVNSTYAVNQSNGAAGNASPNAFTCWVDDVHFLKTPAPKTPPATGGYTVSGKNIVGPSGMPVRLRGLGRPSFEWDPAGFGITREDMTLIKAWGKNVNVVRFSLNQGMWLTGHGAYNQLYAAYVDRAVQWALQQGMAVILDLHWNEGTGNMGAVAGTFGQQPMADTYSVTFWQQVAAKYKNDGRVIFELYNEPHDIPVTTWQNGDANWAGMQQLYNAVRMAGAPNLVLLGGLDWAYDLSQVVGKVTGTNIGYVTHPYVFKTSTTPQNAFITPSMTVPVVATEFGDATTSSHGTGCGVGTYTGQLATFATNNISYTGYAWYEANCGYPSLISDYSGTPSTIGAPVKADLNQ